MWDLCDRQKWTEWLRVSGNRVRFLWRWPFLRFSGIACLVFSKVRHPSGKECQMSDTGIHCHSIAETGHITDNPDELNLAGHWKSRQGWGLFTWCFDLYFPELLGWGLYFHSVKCTSVCLHSISSMMRAEATFVSISVGPQGRSTTRHQSSGADPWE